MNTKYFPLCLTAVYSAAHFAVDFSCILLMVSIIMPELDSEYNWLLCVALYNLSAFALQLPVGALADIIRKNALVSAAGCGFIVLAYGTLFLHYDLITVILAGIGNACFHVGGGIDVIHSGKGNAALPGIFVSTGAIGIYLGSLVYKYGLSKIHVIPAAAVACLLIMAALMLCIYKIGMCGRRINSENMRKNVFLPACICLIVTVFIRSYVGTVISYEWKSSFLPSLLFAAGIVLGKAVGGIIGDKTSWNITGTASLLISCVFLVMGVNIPVFGILGIFVFNMTMPLTLTALADLMPSHTGLAFGMTTFALFAGFMPSLFIDRSLLSDMRLIAAFILISAVLFTYGMYLYGKKGTGQ
jgi:FSR family fosmidomycin resistance protein-like MFS transporter